MYKPNLWAGENKMKENSLLCDQVHRGCQEPGNMKLVTSIPLGERKGNELTVRFLWDQVHPQKLFSRDRVTKN